MSSAPIAKHSSLIDFILSLTIMSEGGKLPWKRQSSKSFAPAPDYKRLLKPLPEPPAGVEWIRDESLAEKWVLVADTNVTAVETVVDVPGNVSNNSNETMTTTTARMIPFETDRLWKEEEKKPMATVVATPSSEQQTSTELVQDEEDGVAMLPQARMVTTATAVASIGAKFKDEDDKKSSVEYTEHIVLPTDTLAGVCLLYKISRRELQRANRFYGNDLRLAPGKLHVPITEKARR